MSITTIPIAHNNIPPEGCEWMLNESAVILFMVHVAYDAIRPWAC